MDYNANAHDIMNGFSNKVFLKNKVPQKKKKKKKKKK